MGPEVYVPKGTAAAEFSEKRSRFIGKAVGVETREEAEAEIVKRREEHPGCSHVVYAFKIGPPAGETMGMSDDGEPKGTAGKPLLEVLKGSGLTNILLTVVRFFGGTKLGTGGLVRAYSRSAKETLEKVRRERYEVRVPFSLTLPYDLYGPAKRCIESAGGRIHGEDFGTAVDMSGEIAENMVQLVEAKILDLSKGEVELRCSKDVTER
jgi:uncharacterized YigZ family protein